MDSSRGGSGGNALSTCPQSVQPNSSPGVVHGQIILGMHSSAPDRTNHLNPFAVRTAAILLVFSAVVGVCLSGCGAFTGDINGSPRSPFISEQPSSETVVASSPATFSVTAFGAQPLHFQWEKNGRPIPGATLASYTTTATTTNESGARFTVIIAGPTGTTVSRPAILTITAPGQISVTPLSVDFGNVPVGSSATRRVTVAALGNSNVTLSQIGVSGPSFDVSGVSAGLVQTPGHVTSLDVTFSPAANGSVAGSISIASDASNPLTVIQLSGSGVHPASHSVSLIISMPTTSDVAGYNLYRASISGGPYAKLTQAMSKTATFTDQNVEGGETYYYVATSVGSSNTESAPSNEVSATVPLT
jgi:Abnormal spindle-like microcephaly-assoc'd, ASPM-SPD-2-Hydin